MVGQHGRRSVNLFGNQQSRKHVWQGQRPE
jgi:hypothetical protein